MQNPQNPTPWEALGIVWDLTISIAVPVTFFALGGRWLDNKTGRSPLFTIIGLILALVIIARIVMKKGKKIAERL
ncbi:MAG: AtpZ/AtpI family protein [bacterium]|nr:AtpZ/AtpI family protein [bacterium]